MSDAGLDILSAKVETLGHDVVDTFYVRRTVDGGKLTDPDALDDLRGAIVVGVSAE
jgi:UTP:GlnB (protein PII) uridylyltransferase